VIIARTAKGLGRTHDVDRWLKHQATQPNLRPLVWKIMLNVKIAPKDYMHYVADGESDDHDKSKSDFSLDSGAG
jgi:hypothetical protein